MGKITVLINPKQRKRYIEKLLRLDGLSQVKEDAYAAYCPISLTNTPSEVKSIILKRQNILMSRILKPAGITAYDPSSAPYSPDKNLTSLPQEVYLIDSGKIAGARYFVGHNLLPSTGQGVEAEKAKVFNRIVVVFMDKKIRISRMQPHRAIYLQYTDFEKEANRFIPVFKLLKEYEPGMGFRGDIPVLLGFKGAEVVDLEELVYKTFPNLQYLYNGKTPTVDLRIKNLELFR